MFTDKQHTSARRSRRGQERAALDGSATVRARAVMGAVLAVPLLAGAGSAAVAADIPGNNTTQAALPRQPEFTEGKFETKGDHDWYRMTLNKGEDYAFGYSTYPADWTNFDFITTFNLRQADGKSLVRQEDGEGPTPGGFYFRPEVSGTYFLDVGQDPEHTFTGTYAVRLTSDCRPNASTQCSLTLGRTEQRLLTWILDVDWYKVTLDKTKSYNVTLHNPRLGSSWRATIVDGSGNPLVDYMYASEGDDAVISNFRPPSSGTYYVEVSADGDNAGLYSLTIR